MHYLERELRGVVGDAALDARLDDGAWYWNLEKPEDEWMSPGFWHTLGYTHAGRSHNPSEWQDLIHPDDLETATAAFESHLADDTPYDLHVRYKAGPRRSFSVDGWVYIRCKGRAVRDTTGAPVRMLGYHWDVTHEYVR